MNLPKLLRDSSADTGRHILGAIVGLILALLTRSLLFSKHDASHITYCDFRQPKVMQSSHAEPYVTAPTTGCFKCPRHGHCEGGELIGCADGYKLFSQSDSDNMAKNENMITEPAEKCVLDSKREERIEQIEYAAKKIIIRNSLNEFCANEDSHLFRRLSMVLVKWLKVDFLTPAPLNTEDTISFINMRGKILQETPVFRLQQSTGSPAMETNKVKKEFYADYDAFILSIKNRPRYIATTSNAADIDHLDSFQVRLKDELNFYLPRLARKSFLSLTRDTSWFMKSLLSKDLQLRLCLYDAAVYEFILHPSLEDVVSVSMSFATSMYAVLKWTIGLRVTQVLGRNVYRLLLAKRIYRRVSIYLLSATALPRRNRNRNQRGHWTKRNGWSNRFKGASYGAHAEKVRDRFFMKEPEDSFVTNLMSCLILGSDFTERVNNLVEKMVDEDAHVLQYSKIMRSEFGNVVSVFWVYCDE